MITSRVKSHYCWKSLTRRIIGEYSFERRGSSKARGEKEKDSPRRCRGAWRGGRRDNDPSLHGTLIKLNHGILRTRKYPMKTCINKLKCLRSRARGTLGHLPVSPVSIADKKRFSVERPIKIALPLPSSMSIIARAIYSLAQASLVVSNFSESPVSRRPLGAESRLVTR